VELLLIWGHFAAQASRGRSHGAEDGSTTRRIAMIQQSMTAPANAEEPCSWGDDGRVWRRIERAARESELLRREPVEVRCGRHGVEVIRSPWARVVMTMVMQDVDERATDLERRAQRAGVVAIGKDGASAAHALIQAACEADREAFHRARKRPMPVHLDDQVDVIRLNRKMIQSDAEALL
jgi:hypothetical protein